MGIARVFWLANLFLSAFAGASAAPVAPLVVMSEDVRATQLPKMISMNDDAGRGNELFVTVRLGTGAKLPFIIDTGSAATILDKSLEPGLGPPRSHEQLSLFGVRYDTASYAAPALFLGKIPLMMTGPGIYTHDMRDLSIGTVHSVKGVLGMDMLCHYCIQLDFAAKKIRFLDDTVTNKSDWGKPFPLYNAGDGCYLIGDNLSGQRGPGSLVDTGCSYDGWLLPALYRLWTNQAPLLTNNGRYRYYGTLEGDIYPQVFVQPLDDKLMQSGDIHMTLNGIGLQFLSRNLVTLDFPQHTLYLKRVSAGFPEDKTMDAKGRREGQSAYNYIIKLQRKGQLPGWSRDDELPENQIQYRFQYPDTVIFGRLTKGWDLTMYGYCVSRTSPGGSWKLVKAWREDAAGHILQQYPLP